ncbi:MAG: DeoR/GlpR family DNA-binding transcription regulator [Treponema sp.]|nr:DeoR/GlpR family DNA-binding transcription regulator [Treponema sp.]
MGESSKKLQRQNQIMQSLEFRRQMTATVEELAAEFSLSPATIRRDLEKLETRGRIVRVMGGVRLLPMYPVVARNFEERSRINQPEKMRIVEKAIEYIPDNSVVILDNGTTSWLLSKKLKGKKNLTVITSSLPIVETLGKDNDIRLMMPGGVFRQRNLDFTGSRITEFFNDICADVAVMTCDSILPAKGVYKIDESSAILGHAMINAARQVFVVASHTKIGAYGTFRFLTPEKIGILFTGSGAPHNVTEQLKNGAFKTIYC